MVNNGILRNKELPLKERGLMVTLLGLPDQWDFSVKGLAAILPDGRDSIGKGLRRLEEMGYLSRYQDRSQGGSFGDTVVEIHEIPIVSPRTDFPCTDKPSTGKPIPENQTQYKTKEYKMKKYQKHKYIKGEKVHGDSKDSRATTSRSNTKSSYAESVHDLYGF